jgi:hypothetical protein
MKTLSILALAAATMATPLWAGQTAVTVTQVAGPVTSVVLTTGVTIYFGPDGQLTFVLPGPTENVTE